VEEEASQHFSASNSILHPIHTSRHLPRLQAHLRIRQHSSAYISIRQHTSAYVSIRQHTSAYVSIRQHTSVPGICPGCKPIAYRTHQGASNALARRTEHFLKKNNSARKVLVRPRKAPLRRHQGAIRALLKLYISQLRRAGIKARLWLYLGAIKAPLRRY
jgi:hypothetical protein